MHIDKKRALLFALMIGTAVVLAQAQTISTVTVNGNTVHCALSNNSGLDFMSVNPYTIKVEYLVNNAAHRCSENIDSALSSTLDFTSPVVTTTDPVVLNGANFVLKIHKSPFSIEFADKSGTAIFTATSVTNAAISASVVSGNYYGVQNSPGSTLVQPATAQTLGTGIQGTAYSPFIWTTKGLGILLDAEKATITRNGTTFNVSRGASTNTNNLFFLMAGSPRQLMQSYYRVTGSFPMPPLWALGFLNSQWGMNQTSMLGYIYRNATSSYRGLDIPIDVYILDYDWFNNAGANGGDFSWNTGNFPDGSTGALKAICDSQGVKIVGIRKPRILNANQDFYQTSVQANYWTQMKTHNGTYTSGNVGYWNDEADYGDPFNFLYFEKLMYNGQRADYPNTRVWSLNRAYEGGAHRYAYGLWSGDINTDFGTMSDQRRFMLSSVNIGAAWWGMDIGGFHGHPSNELYYRWMQFGAFAPIYRVHGTNGEQREPWLYGADGLANAKKFIQIRYSLLPYIYSAYYKLHLQGLPVVRPLVMDYPADNNTASDVNSWIFGDNMLVSPVMAPGATSTTFYLPSDRWVNFWNDQDTLTGGKQITVPVTADMIPVYIKKGSIIPRRPYGRYTNDPLVNSITFHVYSGANGAFDYYEDDGATYNYETGGYCHIAYDHQSAATGEQLIVPAQEGSFTPLQKTGYIAFHSISQLPLSVTIPGQNITSLMCADTNALKQATAPSWCYSPTARMVVIKTANPFATGTFAVLSSPLGTASSIACNATVKTWVKAKGHAVYAQLSVPMNGSSVTIRLFSQRGEVVKTLYAGTMEAGSHHLTLPLGNVARGIYSLCVESNRASLCNQQFIVMK